VSRWNHVICTECWDKREPQRIPSVVIEADTELCCFCEKPTNAGIFLREDPAKVKCGGKHS